MNILYLEKSIIQFCIQRFFHFFFWKQNCIDSFLFLFFLIFQVYRIFFFFLIFSLASLGYHKFPCFSSLLPLLENFIYFLFLKESIIPCNLGFAPEGWVILFIERINNESWNQAILLRNPATDLIDINLLLLFSSSSHVLFDFMNWFFKLIDWFDFFSVPCCWLPGLINFFVIKVYWSHVIGTKRNKKLSIRLDLIVVESIAAVGIVVEKKVCPPCFLYFFFCFPNISYGRIRPTISKLLKFIYYEEKFFFQTIFRVSLFHF